MKRLVLGCALALAVPAQAQQPAAEQQNQALMGALYEAGRCIVARDRGAAVELFRALPPQGDSADPSLAQRVAATGCLNRPLPRNGAIILRGAIAQALHGADYQVIGAPPTQRSRLVDLQLPTGTAGDGVAYGWSDCVVRNDLRNAERLMATAPGSAQETEVLVAMRPYMSACARGTDPGVPDVFLRSLFVQSLYSVLNRYWNGGLRATTGSPNNPIECRNYGGTGSRTQAERYCLPRSDWTRIDEALRAGGRELTGSRQ